MKILFITEYNSRIARPKRGEVLNRLQKKFILRKIHNLYTHAEVLLFILIYEEMN